MKKKINPVGIIVIVIAVIGLVFGGLLIFNERLPEGLIVIGCSAILTALPSLMTPAENTKAKTSQSEPKKSGNLTVRDVVNASILCTCVGRCRINDGAGSDCTLRVTETSLEFVAAKDKMIASPLRKNISEAKSTNSHTLILTDKNGKVYKFVSNDTNAIGFITQLFNRAA